MELISGFTEQKL